MKQFHLKCTINGKRFNGYIDPNLRLIDFIRDVCGLKGTKEGCGQGECGSCMVLLDGRVVNSCLVMAFQANGKKVVTIEGIDKLKYYDIIIRKLKEEGAVQCGFCIPAIVLAAVDLINRRDNVTLDDIEMHLVGNICRCTGYEKIFNAIEGAVNDKRGVYTKRSKRFME